jgi:hypothetical protein
MNKLIKSGIVLAATFSVSLFATADSMKKQSGSSNQFSISASDIKSVPELGDSKQVSAASSASSMKCLVDTPAWDNWGVGRCFSAGFARTTSAYFQIDNAPSNYTVYWSDSRCSSSSLSCVLPIRTYQRITLNATVLNNSNNTFTTTSATAMYEGMD